MAIKSAKMGTNTIDFCHLYHDGEEGMWVYGGILNLSNNSYIEVSGKRNQITMKRKISLIHPGNLASVDYAYASRVPAGMDIIFLAGACPLNQAGEIIYLNDYKLQTKLCMDNLKEVLKECGAGLEDVVYTRVLVASQNQADLVTAWEEIREEFGSHEIPGTLCGVTVLGYKNQLVEIEAVAAVNSLKDE